MILNKIIIGTRGSLLAVAQAEKVKDMLTEKYKELRKKGIIINGFEDIESINIELKTIVTSGDKDLRDFKKIKGDS